MSGSILLIIFVSAVHRHEAQVPFEEYRCGVDVSSRLFSFFMTSRCDQFGINVCCARHDQCYASCAAPQVACDAAFCECLAELDVSLYCRNVVHTSHCNTVQWLGHQHICSPMAQPIFG
ncbi:hypothetical protein Q1695_007970 [Nippostrongylus brasiliensis]|nr:hypothetical protein Q1695_007970 [Nippostrongylus brasiliensis]